MESTGGTFAPVSTTSFYPTKNLGGLGDYGALFANFDEYAGKATANLRKPNSAAYTRSSKPFSYGAFASASVPNLLH